jgi:hypothetical protein
MKDLVLFAVSVYLLRQDVIRASLFKTAASDDTGRKSDRSGGPLDGAINVFGERSGLSNSSGVAPRAKARLSCR